MRDYTEEELKMLSDVLPNIALQLRRRYQYGRKETKQLRIGLCSGTG